MTAARVWSLILTAAVSAAVFCPPAQAAPKTPVKTAPVMVNVDEAARTAENYLNRLKTIRSGFEQVVKGQGVATGTFYLKKPGRFLWAYTYPDRERLISTGKNLYFYEEDSQQVTELPRHTPMSKLLGTARISLKGAGFVVEGAHRQGGRLTLDLRLPDAEADLGNTLTLVFIENPTLQLEQIISTNQLNQKVEVRFFGYEEGVTLEDSLFNFTPTINKNTNEAY